MLMATLDRLVRSTHKQRQTALEIAAPKAHQRIARHHSPSAGHKGGSRPGRKGFRLILGGGAACGPKTDPPGRGNPGESRDRRRGSGGRERRSGCNPGLSGPVRLLVSAKRQKVQAHLNMQSGFTGRALTTQCVGRASQTAGLSAACTESALPGWACEIRTQKCRRKLSL